MNGLEYQIALLEESLGSLDVRYHSLSDVVVSDLLKTLANATAVVQRVAEEQRRRRLQSPNSSPRAALAPGTGRRDRSSPSATTATPTPTETKTHNKQFDPFADTGRSPETLESISKTLGVPLQRIRELNPHLSAVDAQDGLPPNTFIKLPREAMRTPLRQRRPSVPRLPPPPAAAHVSNPSTARLEAPNTATTATSQPAARSTSGERTSTGSNSFMNTALRRAAAATHSATNVLQEPSRQASLPLTDRTPTHRAPHFGERDSMADDAEVAALCQATTHSGTAGLRTPSAERDGFLWTPASVRSPPPANAPAPLPPPPPYRPSTTAAAPHTDGDDDDHEEARETSRQQEPETTGEPSVAASAKAEQPEADVDAVSTRSPSLKQISTRGRSRSSSHGCTHSTSVPLPSLPAPPCAATTSQERSRPSGTLSVSPNSRSVSTPRHASQDVHNDRTATAVPARTSPNGKRGTLRPSDHGRAIGEEGDEAASQRLLDALTTSDNDDSVVVAAAEEEEWLLNTDDDLGASPAGDKSPSTTRRSTILRQGGASVPSASLRQPRASSGTAVGSAPESPPSPGSPDDAGHAGAGDAHSPGAAVPSTLAYFYHHAPPPSVEETHRPLHGAANCPRPAGESTSSKLPLSSTKPLRAGANALGHPAGLSKGAVRALQSLASTTGQASPTTTPPRRAGSPLQLRNLQPTASPTRRLSASLPDATVTTTDGDDVIPPPPNGASTTVLRRRSLSRSVPTSATSSPPPPPPLGSTVETTAAGQSRAHSHAPSPSAAAVARDDASASPRASISPRRSSSQRLSAPVELTAGGAQPEASPAPAPAETPPASGWSPASPETALRPSTPTAFARVPATAEEVSSATPSLARDAAGPSRGFTLPAPEELERTPSSSGTPAQRALSDEPLPPTDAFMNGMDAEDFSSPAPASAALRPRSHSRGETYHESVPDPQAKAANGGAYSDDGAGGFDTINSIASAYGVLIEDILLYNDFLCAYDLDEPLPADLPITLPVTGDDDRDEMDTTEL